MFCGQKSRYVVVLVLELCDFVVREAGVLLLEFWGSVILWGKEGRRCAFLLGFFL